MPDSEQNQILQTAKVAFQHFQTGWRTGDFADYLAMLTDDFEFSFPTGEQRGCFTGKTGREKMVAKCRADAASAVRLVMHEPRTVAVDGNTVIFEYESRGKIGELEYSGRNIIALEIEGDKVRGFREYFGDLDPRLFGGEPQH